jgi:acyl carrier protein
MRFDPSRWCETAAVSAAALFVDLPQSGRASNGLAVLQDFSDPAALRQVVLGQLAAVLRLQPDQLAADKPFRSLGLDSLMGLELRNRLERILSLKLSASTVWNFPTANQLCDHLLGQLGVGSEPPEVGQSLDDELREAEALLAEL